MVVSSIAHNNGGRIDLHVHFVPDFYRAALISADQAHPDGMAAIPAWNPQAALAFMKEWTCTGFVPVT